MKKTPADKAREVVSMMEDGGFEMADFEFVQANASGELLAKVEDHLMKLDEKEAERLEEKAIEEADAARDWAMECKGDMMREDNAAYRRGE
jgi:hypothetical protein